ncbi:MoxR family ATPase [SAR202 cluster bacterium AC-647-N09_OGT_505m]|nr:MoxR family ATPase [SAR202 cluster bacterium AC-647-N09_OGT_505m]
MTEMTAKTIATAARKIHDNIERVIVGKAEGVELVLVAILCEGHVLIEDVPGIGKTLMARSVARSLGCTFRRIQCTPDLLPSDVTGTYIFNQRTSDFEFRAGPIFSQVLLADEINRATPRTQSAFLEAMEERQVTAEGETKPLLRPFIMLATQNPVELEGTFPLPEAQLDRFLMRVRMGYPNEAQDELILERFAQFNPIEDLAPVLSAKDLLKLQEACRSIMVDPDVRQYIIKLVHATRAHPQVELGASPRAMLGLFRTSQALAAIRGRSYVIPDDVKHLAIFVLEHRIVPHVQSHLRGHTSADILREVLDSVPVPVEPGMRD